MQEGYCGLLRAAVWQLAIIANKNLIAGVSGPLDRILLSGSVRCRPAMKAGRGELVVSAPVGFVKAGDHYEKDSDRPRPGGHRLGVQQILELGSARQDCGSTSMIWICR